MCVVFSLLMCALFVCLFVCLFVFVYVMIGVGAIAVLCCLLFSIGVGATRIYM